MDNNELTVQQEGEQSREMAQVQGQVLMAKRFPRDQIAASDRIRQMCQRTRLAENAIYSYPRGGAQIEGPSIRLAEAVSQCWGNIESGVIELSNDGKQSVMQSFAWDLETNNRCTKTFTVKHERGTRQGPVALSDQRDVYEHTANMGARRLRACLLAVIPSDVVEEAMEICNKTMAGESDVPLTDRIKGMIAAFNKDTGVTQKQIEGRLLKKADAITEHELVSLRKVFKSLKDGMSTVDQWFDPEEVSLKKPDKKEK